VPRSSLERSSPIPLLTPHDPFLLPPHQGQKKAHGLASEASKADEGRRQALVAQAHGELVMLTTLAETFAGQGKLEQDLEGDQAGDQVMKGGLSFAVHVQLLYAAWSHPVCVISGSRENGSSMLCR
jgi:hypothetical protein